MYKSPESIFLRSVYISRGSSCPHLWPQNTKWAWPPAKVTLETRSSCIGLCGELPFSLPCVYISESSHAVSTCSCVNVSGTTKVQVLNHTRINFECCFLNQKMCNVAACVILCFVSLSAGGPPCKAKTLMLFSLMQTTVALSAFPQLWVSFFWVRLFPLLSCSLRWYQDIPLKAPIGNRSSWTTYM